MAKSLRSKRARKFRAIKREKNEVLERRRVNAVAAKLGTLPPDVILEDEPPKRFAHKAPKDEGEVLRSIAIEAYQAARHREQLASKAMEQDAAAVATEPVAAVSTPARSRREDRATRRVQTRGRPSLCDGNDMSDDESEDEVAGVVFSQLGQFKRPRHAGKAQRAEVGQKNHKSKARRQRSQSQRVFL